MEQAAAYAEAIGREIGRDLRLSKTGSLFFELDGRGLLLQWQEASRSFVVYVEIGPLAGWRDGEVCRRLLSANFLLVQTRGGALSYDAAANMVGLNYVLPVYGVSPEEFVRNVNAVIVLADEWKAELVRLCAEQEKAVAADQEQIAAADSAPAGDVPPPFLLRV